jgi:membrane protein required for colicin V production
MNAVDIGILVIVGLFAVGGLRRGFLLGVVDLVAFGLAIVVAARLAGSVAAPLRAIGVSDTLAAGAGFVVAVVVSMAVIGLAGRILLAPLGAIGAGTPLGWANGILGLLPGALRGLAIAALLVMLLMEFPPELGLRSAINQSRLAQPLVTSGRAVLAAGLEWAGIELWTLGGLDQSAGAGTVDHPLSSVTAAERDPIAAQAWGR